MPVGLPAVRALKCRLGSTAYVEHGRPRNRAAVDAELGVVIIRMAWKVALSSLLEGGGSSAVSARLVKWRFEHDVVVLDAGL
jgi:hypothetical protein